MTEIQTSSVKKAAVISPSTAWRRLSIRNKQLVFFAIIISFLSIISVGSYIIAYTFMDRFNTNMTAYYRINRLLLQFTENREMLDRYLRTGDQDILRRYYQHSSDFDRMLDQVEAESNLSLDTYFLFNAIHNSMEVYTRENRTAIELRRSGREDYYLPFSEAVSISRYIEKYIQNLLYVSLSEGSWRFNRTVERMRFIRTGSFIGILAITAISFVFSLLFSASLTNPVRKLAASAHRISQGQLDVQDVKVSSSDEIGVLSDAFNRMSASIRQMVNDLKEKAVIEAKLHEEELTIMRMEQSLKEAQFLSLQAQINPHFLFNTLNTISRTAMFEGAQDTSRLIRSLSNLFRYNLKNISKTVTLAEELEIISEYMHIQQVRFGERISYRLRCEVLPEEFRIPSLVIQPFVENAVIHGLEPLEEGGTLSLIVRQKGGRIRIGICDTGVGMTHERLDTIRGGAAASYPSGDNSTSIGMRNVIRRLGLYYSGEEKVSIASRPGRGTIVSLSLPVSVQEQDHV